LLFSTLWQVLFFDQTFSNYQIAGVALIVTAAVMNSFAAQLYKLIGVASARLV
jgi:drug/metabolite transporter (DMT)-like permease